MNIWYRRLLMRQGSLLCDAVIAGVRCCLIPGHVAEDNLNYSSGRVECYVISLRNMQDCTLRRRSCFIPDGGIIGLEDQDLVSLTCG